MNSHTTHFQTRSVKIRSSCGAAALATATAVLNSRSPMAYHKAVGNAHYAAKRYDEAVKAYSDGLEACSDDVERATLFSNRSAAQLGAGRLEAAALDADACIMLRPAWEKGWFRAAQVFEAQGDLMQALGAYGQALQVSPDNKELRATVKRVREKVEEELSGAARAKAEERMDAWLKEHGPEVRAEKQAFSAALTAKSGPRPRPTLKAVRVKAGPWSNWNELRALIKPFTFKSHGIEAAEKAQLKGMGWKPYETGNFYNETDHLWYFFAYGGEPSKKANKAMQAALGQSVLGDVVVVKSGPASWRGPDVLSEDEVADAILFLSSRDPKKVFAERERKRVYPDLPEHVPTFHTAKWQAKA